MEIKITYEALDWTDVRDDIEKAIEHALKPFGLKRGDSGMGMGQRDLFFNDKPITRTAFLCAAIPKKE